MAPTNAPSGGSQSTDTEVRLAAFQWLEAQTSLYGEVLARTLLEEGFQFQNRRVPLLGPQGIWKPQVLPQYPLSIATTPKGPYKDSFGSDGLLSYAYRGMDPEHRDNLGLRAALTHQVPLVYFHGIMPGRYLAAWPVYVVGDDLRGLRCQGASKFPQLWALKIPHPRLPFQALRPGPARL